MKYIDEMINRYGEELAMELIEELIEWRDVQGYEGQYRVSEWGNIMSLKNGKKKILKQHKDRYGYYFVNLYKDGKPKGMTVHRLVAIAFCEGAGEFDCVNHEDEDKDNNDRDNLEWCSFQYNSNYGSLVEKKASRGFAPKRRVRCIELDIIFESVSAAARYVNGDTSKISKCCKPEYSRSKHKGYHWEYVD